jgi:hypothetical protein
MQRWKAYLKSIEVYRRRAPAAPAGKSSLPDAEPNDPDDIGAPWFPDCEPFPRAT